MSPMEKRIAVVDDDEAVRESLCALLRSVGYDAKVFASAADFLNSCESAQTHCLIVDLRMPDMTGLELVDRLASQGMKISVILISGNYDDAARSHAKQAGIVALLEKPFSDDALLDSIRQALS